VGLCFSAWADDGTAYPELDTEAYCTALVSKMLNPDEKRLEHEKCLAEEAKLRETTRPLWHLVPAKTQKMIVATYFTEPRFQTYQTVYKYVSYWISQPGRKTP